MMTDETYNTRSLARLLDALGDEALELKVMARTVDALNEKTAGSMNITSEAIVERMDRILAIKDKLYGLLEEQDLPVVKMSRAEHLRQRAIEEEDEKEEG